MYGVKGSKNKQLCQELVREITRRNAIETHTDYVAVVEMFWG